MVISGLYLREILDSRGYPTVEAEIYLEGGIRGVASVPSGASVGAHEAVEVRDGNKNRYRGRGVLETVRAARDEILDVISGLDASGQSEIDRLLCELDGTENKSRLGGNVILAVSLATARAAAQNLNIPLYRYLGGPFPHLLPVPLANILNGGQHADNPLNIQEFMILPLSAPHFRGALRMVVEITYALRDLLLENGHSVNLGDEGGFAPAISTPKEAFSLLTKAVKQAGYIPEKDIVFALDCAASEFFNAKDQTYSPEQGQDALSRNDMVGYLSDLVDKWPIFSIEDGMAEDDGEGWSLLTKKLGHKVQLVGDDFFVTNPKRLEKGIALGQANALLVKPNQIGSLSETFKAVHMAQSSGYRAVMSHRSGETEDSSIADLALAWHCGQIKTGAVARGERTAKYNRLIRIESELGAEACYAGKMFC